MSFVVDTARKDWLRQRRDVAELVVWLGLPIVIGGLMWLVSGGKEGPKPQAHVLVADEDSSVVTRFLLGALESSGGLVQVEKTTREEGRRRIDQGHATALLVLPDGFADAALREKPVTISLVTNPAQRFLPEIVEEELEILGEGVFYAQRLIGDDLRAMAEGPPPGEESMPEPWISDFSVRVNRLVSRIADDLSPRVIDLETVAAEEEKAPTYAELFLPGLLVMSLLFMARSISDGLWREREERTLRRVVTSPRGVVEFLAGRVLFGGTVMLAISAFALVVAAALGAVAWNRVPLAVVWAALSGVAILTLMIVLQLLSPSQRAAEIISLAVTFPLMMMGGSFFPFEAMPAWMAAAGSKTPNGWAVIELKRIFFGTPSPATLAAAFVGMLAMASLLFAIGAARLRAGFAQE